MAYPPTTTHPPPPRTPERDNIWHIFIATGEEIPPPERNYAHQKEITPARKEYCIETRVIAKGISQLEDNPPRQKGLLEANSPTGRYWA